MKSIVFPRKLCSDKDGYNFLINLFSKYKDINGEEFYLDFKYVTWFEANLCSILGLIAYKIKDNFNNLKIINVADNVGVILKKNNFLVNVNNDQKIDDIYKTTIKYKRFTLEDETTIKAEVLTELMGINGFPNMSKDAKNKMEDSMYEIFKNCFQHGDGDAFCCGQHYPSVQKHKLCLTISNTGETIQQKVSEYTKKSIDIKNSIEWAIKKGNSTKDNKTGGLGLYLLSYFIDMNKGKFQIITGNCLWEKEDNKISTNILDNSFNGVIVNIEYNTMDTNLYYTQEEIDDIM